MYFFKNCGIITILDRDLKNLIFLPYWYKSTGLSALCMERYCEKMNFLVSGHQKKMYGSKIFYNQISHFKNVFRDKRWKIEYQSAIIILCRLSVCERN